MKKMSEEILRCAIIDDEPVARKILREYAEDVDFLRLAGEFGDAVEAYNFICRETVDLIFLDIEMPRLSGIELLKSVKRDSLVVLTTAYPQFALESYELDVLDYLLKPIAFERFLKAAEKSRARLLANNRRSAAESPPEFFFVKSNRRIERVAFDDVLYVEGLSNYVVIHTADKKLVAYLTFKNIEAQLPAERFVRIHKSYLVALAAISRIEDDTVALGSSKLPVGKFYRDHFLQKIASFSLKR